ncbi:MAG: ice-binding family protein [Candidatus Limnocylindrales bacterium]
MKALRILGLTAFLAVFLTGPALAAQPPVGLGAAVGFAVLAGSTITNTGPTTITGDVGLSPGTSVTGFETVTLNGTQHVADAAALQAQNALTTAYNDAAGRTPVTTVAAELGGQVLVAGVYASQDGAFLLTGALTLNGEGNPNAVFVFKAASTLTTASGSSVVLSGSAQSCNVFWEIGSSATLGTRSALKGTVLAQDSITITTSATLDGRAMARSGAVTLDTNVIAQSTCTVAAATPTPASGAAATPTPVGTVPPTSTGGSGDTGSGTNPSMMILFAGLAASAAFVTIRRLGPIRR